MKPSRPRIGRMRALARYFRDRDASVLGKLLVFAAAVYVVVPIDLIPDVPIVGWLDDLGVMGIATAWLSRVIGRYRELPEATIDAPMARGETRGESRARSA